jgi:hypothetical protein
MTIKKAKRPRAWERCIDNEKNCYSFPFLAFVSDGLLGITEAAGEMAMKYALCKSKQKLFFFQSDAPSCLYVFFFLLVAVERDE